MKRINISLNLTELKLLQHALIKLGMADLSRDDAKAYQRIDELLDEQIDTLAEEIEHSKMYNEDENGYESLNDYGRESLQEKYGTKDE
jgi:hypothetical protein